MKKFILILSVLLGSLSIAFAQEQPNGERIKALYVAYVTDQLKLTPDESQKFWALHTQFETDMRGVGKDQPELVKQQARLDIKKKYQDGFTRIIGSARCDRFYKIGDEWTRKLMERMQKRADNQRPNMRRGQ